MQIFNLAAHVTEALVQRLILCFVFLSLCCLSLKAQTASIPHVEKRGQSTQLIVNGQPFLVLGGELHNSSSSSVEYMKPIWGRLASMHLNTALAAVSWELIEPEEGRFDFSLVDSMIEGARNSNLHLVLLWFASWKNGFSHYTPAWVKQNFRRFPVMHIKDNKAVEAISPLSEEAMRADAKAFAMLLKHVKQIDAGTHTVITVQIENEVGLIGGPRDRGELADKAYEQSVPKELMDHLQKNKESLLPELKDLWAAKGFRNAGSWEQVFGATAAGEEAFMAWHYARYINKIAEAGKAQYNLPMFVNAWIRQPEDLQPGDYPSGGPQAHMHDIYRAGAPDIDLLTPDIYLPDFDVITALYTRSGNALFVPESRGGELGAANAFYAIGQHNAIGYSPFGIDRIADSAITKAYAILQQLSPEILQAQAKGAIAGVWLNPGKSRQKIQMGGYTLEVSLRHSVKNPAVLPQVGYGLIMSIGQDEFIVAGKDIQMNFHPLKSGLAYVGYRSIDEGSYKNGKWVTGRRLNGDDIMYNYNIAEEAANQRTGTVVRLSGDGPRILRVKLYRFE